MINVDRISKSYGPIRAVEDVSFAIGRGECVGLLGPNGAGKSTTIKVITGYIPPSAGSASVGGFDTIGESIKARRLIGYLPESTALYPEMRVRDFLNFRARLYPLSRAQRVRGVEQAIERCWLREVAGRRIGELSKGYKQRTGLASALVHSPPVLVLDEPTSGLDPSQILEARSLIRSLAEDRTVLVCSHILPEIEQTCGRVLIIARGRLRADGSPAELVASMHTGGEHVVEADAPGAVRDRVLAALAGVGGVTGVRLEAGRSDGRWAHFAVSTDAEHPDVREGLARALAGLGVLAREIRRPAATLEQVFMRVIESEGAVGGVGKGGHA
jgi:ABC-2 type transport system ATP-binding protein